MLIFSISKRRTTGNTAQSAITILENNRSLQDWPGESETTHASIPGKSEIKYSIDIDTKFQAPNKIRISQ